MQEIENIQTNNQGELPNAPYDVLQVSGLTQPAAALADYKQYVLTILQHPELDPNASEWERLLPSNLVEIVKGFVREDYVNDDGVCNIKSLVSDVRSKNIKKWTWYSSKVTEDGFEVYFEGIFRGRHTFPVRFLGIKASNILILRAGKTFHWLPRKDVIEYKGLSNYA